MPFGYTPIFKSDKYQVILGKFIRHERTSQNLSLIELSKIVGIDASYLSAIESGKKCPSELTATSILEALAISFDFEVPAESKLTSKFQHYYEMLLNDSDDIPALLSELINYKNSFLYPYVLLAEYVYDEFKHTAQYNVSLDQLKEFYDYCDESFKAIVNDYDIMNCDSELSTNQIEQLYTEKISISSSNANSLMFSDLPIALLNLHAATFFNDNKLIIKSIAACQKAQAIFQHHINITGLFAVKELNAKNMVLAHDYDGAIAEYLDFTYNQIIASNPLVIAQCYENIGAIYYELKDYPQAIHYLQLALKENYECKCARFYLALCYYKCNDNSLNDLINSFKSFNDPVNSQLLELIQAIADNDYNRIDLIYQDISLNELFANLMELIERLLFDYYSQKQQYDKATFHATKLLNLIS